MKKYMIMLILAVALIAGMGKGMKEAEAKTQEITEEETQEITEEEPGEEPEEEPKEEEKATYTITFKLKGGLTESGEKKVCLQVTEGELPGAEAGFIPVKTGYVFLEWRDAEGKAWDLNQPVQQDITLTAYWKSISYQVKFNGNGGTGKMQNQYFNYGESNKLLENKYTRKGYVFAGWNTQKNGKGTLYKNTQKVKSLTAQEGKIVTLYAVWKGIPYKIKYNGNGADKGKMENSSHEYGKKQKLSACKFKKKGYNFTGWNTKKNGKGKKYKNRAAVKNLTTTKKKTIVLYAQWKRATYTITYHTGKGKLDKNVRKKYNIDTKTFTLPKPSRKGYDFDGWYKEKKFKHRIDKVKKGRTGNLKLYAKWVKCKRKAKIGAAKITRCSASGTGKVKVKASVKKRIASSDDYYYLVYVNPRTGNPYRVAKKTYKNKEISFTLDTTANQGFAVSMFGIATKKDGKYQLLSKPSYVKNPEKAAKNKMKYKPGKTKKGIQFYYGLPEVSACDAKQYFLNFTTSMLLDNGSVPYKYNGKTYWFNPMDYYRGIVAECNKKNVNVTMQVMLDWREGHTDLIDARARVQGAAPFYSWNITSNSSREKMEAMFSYLGVLFGQKDCYVSNWILGNEVNNPACWHYAGSMSDQAFFESYAYAFRILYYAVRSQYANAKVFICTDNYWNTSSSRRYSARQVVDFFPRYLNSVQKGLEWNLAYHAYSYPITYTEFWKGYGITNDINTPSVTMKNLNVLTDYIRNTYGSSVRIILSEQGFSSISGEAQQAAAIAYGYYIAACNPMVDAFIIRSYDDHPVEVAMGLRMGIAGKQAFSVFKYMDTAYSAQYTNPYLGVIGASSWQQIVPGYKEDRIRKMYRKI